MDISVKALYKNVMERLAGPTGSILLHAGLILAALFLVTMSTKDRQPEIEVQVVEVEETTLDELLDDLQPPEELPDMVDTITPPDVNMNMTPPPDVQDFAASPVADTPAELDIASEAFSPIIMKNLAPGNMSNRSGEGRAASISAYGGRWGEYAEAAVLRALEWLKNHQNEDGSWGDNKGYVDGLTGLGILTFLAHGETPSSEKYGETVERAIRYVCARQNDKGEFTNIKRWQPGQKGRSMDAAPVYCHAICVYAISEAYGLTRITDLKEVMERGVQVLIDAQQPGGGFEYGWAKGDTRDTSLGGWCCQAMKAAYIAGASNPGLHDAMEKSVLDMKSAQLEDGSFRYAEGKGQVTNMTAVACLSMQLLGHANDKEVLAGEKFLSDATCDWKKPIPRPMYAWYYISQVKFHMGKTHWTSWNEKFAPQFIRNQNEDGSWDSAGLVLKGDSVDREWLHADLSSKVYSTTLAALTLQVYYRFLPTYKPVDEAPAQTASTDVEIEIF